MSDSFTHIYIHVIFSVKYRKNSLIENLRPSLFRYIAGIARNKNCTSEDFCSGRGGIFIGETSDWVNDCVTQRGNIYMTKKSMIHFH
ncbi:MAG: hypothetical protein D6732_19965 [Methanobacteriota archaeon]|nr:MAG: hypothetical protein D6732_19965 [Euryarchaeota archaeon]